MGPAEASVSLPLLLDGAIGSVVGGVATVLAAWGAVRYEGNAQRVEKFDQAIADVEARVNEEHVRLRDLMGLPSPRLAESTETWVHLIGVTHRLRRVGVAAAAMASRLPWRKRKVAQRVAQGILSDVAWLEERFVRLSRDSPKGSEPSADELAQVLADQHRLMVMAVLDFSNHLGRMQDLGAWWDATKIQQRERQVDEVGERWPAGPE